MCDCTNNLNEILAPFGSVIRTYRDHPDGPERPRLSIADWQGVALQLGPVVTCVFCPFCGQRLSSGDYATAILPESALLPDAPGSAGAYVEGAASWPH